MRRTVYLFILIMILNSVRSQVSIQYSPARLYFYNEQGKSSTQEIILTNPGEKELEIIVSVKDWGYDSLGGNHFFDAGTLSNSCANWIQVEPSPYLNIKPKQQVTILVTLRLPVDVKFSSPVNTAMVFFTQINSRSNNFHNGGASVRIAMQVGTKIYHSFLEKSEPHVEILDLKEVRNDSSKLPPTLSDHLELSLLNNGQMWIEGEIETELFCASNGKKNKLPDIPLYSLPGDKRVIRIPLPKLKEGKYIATVLIKYSKKDKTTIGELEFFID